MDFKACPNDICNATSLNLRTWMEEIQVPMGLGMHNYRTSGLSSNDALT